jgi:hypothetical protein
MTHLELVRDYTLDVLLDHLKEAAFCVELRNQLGSRGWIVVHNGY